MDKVTVIYPVYNRSHLLKKALIALNHQSFIPQEVVLSDDGSEEDIVAAVREISDKIKFEIKYIRQKDKGFRLARCRNNGVRIASGNYLIFLDQDIIYTKHFIRTYVKNRKRGFFLVAWPIRLTREETNRVDLDMIESGEFDSIITKNQIKLIKDQFFKEKLYHYLKRLHLRKIGPKLRGGVFSIYKDDFALVNGFDEGYQGWGYEDDDLGHRLNRAGIKGMNPFYSEYSLHLYHEPFHVDGERVNEAYHLERKKMIRRGDYRCKYGLDNPIEDDKITEMKLK